MNHHRSVRNRNKRSQSGYRKSLVSIYACRNLYTFTILSNGKKCNRLRYSKIFKNAVPNKTNLCRRMNSKYVEMLSQIKLGVPIQQSHSIQFSVLTCIIYFTFFAKGSTWISSISHELFHKQHQLTRYSFSSMKFMQPYFKHKMISELHNGETTASIIPSQKYKENAKFSTFVYNNFKFYKQQIYLIRNIK